MIHSGSRNVGKQIADYYYKLAKDQASFFGYQIPQNWQLDGFPVDSEIGQSYLREMNWALDFAYKNRKMMSDIVKGIFQQEWHGFEVEEEINIHHNYAAEEEHFGEKVWVHRKGATQAKLGQTGIIPGSQGTRSYITTGLGNPESFMSSSHGSGRMMGRKEATRQLDLKEQQEILDNQGIIHGMTDASKLDEAPGAYKDIDMVMGQQKDLVDIKVALRPIAVVKG